jgi:hypothetical protein
MRVTKKRARAGLLFGGVSLGWNRGCDGGGDGGLVGGGLDQSRGVYEMPVSFR